MTTIKGFVRDTLIVLGVLWFVTNVFAVIGGIEEGARKRIVGWPRTYGQLLFPGYFAGAVIGKFLISPVGGILNTEI